MIICTARCQNAEFVSASAGEQENAKLASATVSKIAMDIDALIEQMRCRILRESTKGLQCLIHDKDPPILEAFPL